MDIITTALLVEEGQSIACFRPGDMIIRVKSVEKKTIEYCHSLGMHVQVITDIDHRCRLAPVKFLGVHNNVIYVREIYPEIDDSSNQTIIMDGVIIKFRIEDYSDNWSKFDLPQGVELGDTLD